MKIVFLSICTTILLLTGFTGHGKADLVDLGRTTLDPATQLEWLDLTVTIGIEYSGNLDVFGPLIEKEGYHMASDIEMKTMLLHAGLQLGTPWGCCDEHGNSQPVRDEHGNVLPNQIGYESEVTKTFIDLFGITDEAPEPKFTFTQGYFQYSETGEIATYQVDTGTISNSSIVFTGPNLHMPIGPDFIGSFLVRNYVPLPSAVLLLGSGLFFLRFYRRTQRKGA